MANSIEEIHQEVFHLLMTYHKKDPNFLFTFRRINRKSRLEKGYWFLGDDHYLTVSFWRGRDWITRMPNISFTIKLEGDTYVEFNAKSVSQKFDFFAYGMIKNVGAKSMEFNYGYYKDYPEFGNDFIRSLESFINKDKIIIDEAVHNNRAFNPGALEYTDPIEFIYPSDFKAQLDNIKKYQKLLADRIKTTGFLKYFSVKDFGPIKELSITEIPDGCKWIFLTGENGAGKTSLLKAITTGLCNNIDNGERVAEGYGDFIIKLGIDRPNTVTHYIINHAEDPKDKKWIPKGFAVYGPIRLLTQGGVDTKLFTIDNKQIDKKATFGLFNPFGVLRDLSVPYALKERPKYQQMAIENLIENLVQIIPNIFHVDYELKNDGILLSYFQNKPIGDPMVKGIPFEQLPSGTRNFTALILDLLIRFAEQQPKVYDPAEYNGIVLIDEIDLHLHPKMQKEIIIQLAETFPKIQFIVTTHSPIPLLGAPKNSLFINIFKDDENIICIHQLDIDIADLLPNAILSSPIFDFDGISSVNHDENNRLITEDNYSDAIFYKILDKKIKDRTLNLKD